MKKLLVFIFIILIIALMILLSIYIKNALIRNNTYISSVQDVIGGDFIQLPNGKIVDLAGAYIPRKGEINYKEELEDNIRKLLLHKDVKIKTIEKKNVDYPQYDLVEIYIDDNKESINEKLLKEGMAFFDQGYYKNKGYFYKLQKQAEKNKVGIWKDRDKLKILYVSGEYLKQYYLPDDPAIKDLKEYERIYYYFEPPVIFEHRYPAVYTPYWKSKRDIDKEISELMKEKTKSKVGK